MVPVFMQNRPPNFLAQPRPDIVPSPVDVANALGSAWDSGRLQEAVATSLERGVVGFLIAIAVGTPIGLLLAEVRPIRRAVGPIISGLQVLPSVAWVPAAIIWFGLSDATVYFVILMGAIGCFGYNFQTILPLIAEYVLNADAAAFGLLTSSMALGSVGSALLMASRGRVSRRRIFLGADTKAGAA